MGFGIRYKKVGFINFQVYIPYSGLHQLPGIVENRFRIKLLDWNS